MSNNINKAIEISDAKIQFVSLVAKAANKKQFLITKADGGNAQFSSFGKILKADVDTHYVTGIVYEPLTEDTDGNFMTAEEIQKAARWFVKNGDKVDIQHSYEAAEGATVVESYITPCDFMISDTPVIKGTWVMTVEIDNAQLWDAVQKGEITGFSMGGVGKYSEEDVNLDEVIKTAPASTGTVAIESDESLTAPQKKGVIKTILSTLGFDVVEKGEVAERFAENTKYSNFWNAWYALEGILYRWNRKDDRYEFEFDEATIREALTDFSTIITDILVEKEIAKSLSATLPVKKSGKKISSANKKKLDDAYQLLTELCEAFTTDESEIEKEETTMNNEIKKAIEQIVADTFAAQLEKSAAPAVQETTPAVETMTAEVVQNMINEAVEKAFEERGMIKDVTPAENEEIAAPLTTEEVQKMVSDIMAPILKARGLPHNLNGEPTPQIEKSDEAFDGFFV